MYLQEQVSGDSFRTFTQKDLHDIIRASTEKYFDRKFTDLEEKLVAITKCPPTKLEEFRKVINNFKIVYKRHWKACESTENRFLEKHNEWLQQTIDLPCYSLLSAASSKGRPSKEFIECSERSKRRKTMDIRKNVPFDQLTYAAEMSNRTVGNIDTAKLIHDIQKSPSRATKVRKAVCQQTTTKKRSPEEALRIFIKANLTKAQYEVIQIVNKDVYTCYRLLQKAKQETYPPKIVSETEAEVKLQDLVNNTTLRLYKYLEDVTDKCSEFLIHLTYKLKANIHKGRVQKQDKTQIEAAKVAIQKSFEERMGLLVDIPKAGYGNTNDGNTSRRFLAT